MSFRFLAMIGLSRPANLNATAIFEVMRTAFPGVTFEHVAGIAERDGPGQGKPVTEDARATFIKVGRTLFMCLTLDQPWPSDTLDVAIANERIWTDAAQVMAGVRAHVIVSPFEAFEDPDRQRQAAVDLTVLLTAMSSTLPTLGIYWSNAETIRPPEAMPEFAADALAGNWPHMLWVQMLWFGERPTATQPAQYGCLTRGLLPFIGREIEFEKSPTEPEIIFNRLAPLINYLLSGNRIADGDTVGTTATERIRVTHKSLDGIASAPNGLPVLACAIEHLEGA